MRHRFCRTMAPLLAALWLLAAWGRVLSAEDVHLVILHLNDTHGRLEPFADKDGKSKGGLARIATMVKRARAENPGRVLFLDAGDMLSKGDALTIRDGGEQSLHLLDVMGVDAFTPGNGDFYFSLENLLHLVPLVKYPVLDANLTWRESGRRPFTPSAVKEVAGIKVAILGLGFIHVELPSARKLDYHDPVAVAKELAPGLRRQAALVLALTHIGIGDDEKLAAEVPEIDLIVGGHTHTVLQTLRRVKKTPGPGETFIAQAGEYGRFLGRIDLNLKREGDAVQIESAEGRLLPVDDSVPQDPQMAALLKKAHSTMDETVFTSEVEVPAPSAGRSPMGEFLAEAVRTGVGADVAFLDRGAVKAGIAPGKGTWWDIYRIHPWRNQVLLATCTGRQVQEALSKLDLLFAGCSFQKTGAEITDLKIGGRPVDPNRSYTVAINDYLFWTTPLLKDLPYRETPKRVDTLLVQRLKGR